jgi:hypothetical protein
MFANVLPIAKQKSMTIASAYSVPTGLLPVDFARQQDAGQQIFSII